MSIRKIGVKKLAKLGGKLPFSTAPRQQKEVRKSNPEATKKRRARNAKRMRGKEYQDARKGAMERSGGQCEFETELWGLDPHECVGVTRCGETEGLQFHEEHYARGRILTADDGKMVCPPHHRYLESLKPHKQHRRGF